MNKHTPPGLLLAVALGLSSLQPAAAQADKKVYTYVEQMPQLPGTNASGAIQAAIQKNLRYPADAVRDNVAGRIFVAFVVTEKGEVTQSYIVKGLSTSTDAAVLDAVKRLPRFVPGKQNGQAVSVSLTIPVTLAYTVVGGKNVGVTAASAPAPAGQSQGQPLSEQEQEQDSKVYTYVEQMPQLPGGGGTGAIVAAVQQRLVPPADAPAGRIFVKFTVTRSGDIQDPEIVKGLSASADAAVLAALRKLPKFIPGKQNSRAVSVSFTLPITVGSPVAASPAPAAAESAAADSTTRVYTYVEQMPALPGGGGQQAIVAAVQQRLVLPATIEEGRVFAKFTVGPHGSVYDAEIVKGLGTTIDAAVLAAIRKLPRFVPGKQHGRVVAVSFTVPVSILLPNHVFEVREVATRARFPQPSLYAYLKRNLQVPAVVATEKLHGLVGVDFVVLPSGKLDQPTLTSHVCSSCDAEVLRVVSSFPAWMPARDLAGRAVAVRQHLDVPLPLPTPTLPYTKPTKPYTYVAQFPTLLDGTPLKDLGSLLTQTIRYPETARREKIIGNAQVEFIVDTEGFVHDAQVTQSVCSSCDQAIIDALMALSPFVPGRQADQPVPMQLQVAVPFNPVAPATPGR